MPLHVKAQYVENEFIHLFLTIRLEVTLIFFNLTLLIFLNVSHMFILYASIPLLSFTHFHFNVSHMLIGFM